MSLTRRALLRMVGTSTAAIAVWGCAVATPAKRVPRLGFFGGTNPPDPAVQPLLDAFFNALAELGYEDGKSIQVEWRYTGGDDSRFDEIAREFASLPVDIMAATSATAQRAALRATSTIPIVMLLGSDPVEAGLVKSLARPGGNLTGMASLTAVTSAKRVDILSEAFPKIARVAILELVRENDPSGPLQLDAAGAAARALNIEPIVLDVRDPAEVPDALKKATTAGADSLLLCNVPTQIIQRRKEIVAYATSRRIPSAYPNVGAFVEEGGLIGFGQSAIESFRRAASYVDRILKGANPAEMPIEQPTKFDLVVNLKAAREIGLTVAPSILNRATSVIQ